MAMPHPNAPAARPIPARFVVVDGWAYWRHGVVLMNAPVDAHGAVAWDQAAVRDTSNEVADVLLERMHTTFCLIDMSQRRD